MVCSTCGVHEAFRRTQKTNVEQRGDKKVYSVTITVRCMKCGNGGSKTYYYGEAYAPIFEREQEARRESSSL